MIEAKGPICALVSGLQPHVSHNICFTPEHERGPETLAFLFDASSVYFGCGMIVTMRYVSAWIRKWNRQSRFTRACQRSVASSYFFACKDGCRSFPRATALAYRTPVAPPA